MRRIATLPYNELSFVFISNHYDVHISGLCEMGGTYFYFKTIDPEADELRCEVWDLTFKEDIKWRLKKFLFEQMVGYHYSYPQRKKGYSFYYRKPVWLYKILFKLYYKLK